MTPQSYTQLATLFSEHGLALNGSALKATKLLELQVLDSHIFHILIMYIEEEFLLKL